MTEKIRKDNILKVKSMESTIVNILETSKSIGAQSMSMPAISSGLFGFPIAKCAKIIL